MKKIIVLAILLLFVPSLASAAGIWAEQFRRFNEAGSSSNIWMLRFTCVANASGNFPGEWTSNKLNGLIMGVDIIPKSPAPANNWDISILDWTKRDLLNGLGTDMSASDPLYIPIKAFDNGSDISWDWKPVLGRVYISIGNMNVANSQVEIAIYVYRGP